MKTLFSVGSITKGTHEMTLLLEIGTDCVVYAFLNEKSRSFELIRYVSVDEFELAEKLPTILEELQQENPVKVVICSGLPQA
ncbi:MAG TPA: hypothetical protein VGO09_00210, partial [Flavisolibacter sp.]|nr:hypothetical protein [Flavisolibacter sp.]